MKIHQSGQRRLVHIAATLFSALLTPPPTFISELFFCVNGIFWGRSTQPSVIITHLTMSVALLLSALMQQRFTGRQYKRHALAADVTHGANVTNHPPPPLLQRSLIISQSMLMCSSPRVCLLLLIIYSFLFLSSWQTCEQTNRHWKWAAEFKRGRGRAGRGRRGQAYWSSPSKKRRKKK